MAHLGGVCQLRVVQHRVGLLVAQLCELLLQQHNLPPQRFHLPARTGRETAVGRRWAGAV